MQPGSDVAPPLADGRYRLVEVLGEGGMATVFRATDTFLGVQRAVKVLDNRYLNRPGIRARFLTEARTMARLDHPGIVRVHDVIVEERAVCIVIVLAPCR